MNNPAQELAPAADRTMVYAVIPAAGTGSRMKAEHNKQLLEVGGLPLLLRTLLAFEQCPAVDGFLVVVSPAERQTIAELLQHYDLTKLLGLADGGRTRQDSVLSGLRELAQVVTVPPDVMVLVHDGARCFITTPVIERCIRAIVDKKAACGVAVPVKDTIKEADPDGRVRATLDRNRLWSVQTPQGAMLQPMLAAYETLASQGLQVTDDLAVMEAAGYPVYLVAGDYTNIKMTTPEDLVIGEALAMQADRLSMDF